MVSIFFRGRKSFSIDGDVSVDVARFILSLYGHIDDIDG